MKICLRLLDSDKFGFNLGHDSVDFELNGLTKWKIAISLSKKTLQFNSIKSTKIQLILNFAEKKIVFRK